MKTSEKLGVALVVVSVFNYFLLVVYPSVSDFDYWLMRAAIDVQTQGHVSVLEGTAGFYVETVALSRLSGIGYDVIPTLPLQLFPLVFIGLALYKRMTSRGVVYLPLALLYLTSIGYSTAFTWVSHDIGLLLVMCCMLLVLIRGDASQSSPRIATSIAIIILLISLNFMSYKLIFVALVFLTVLRFLEGGRNSSAPGEPTDPRSRVVTLALIGTVLVLVYNGFFYASFLPLARLASETLSLPGVERLFDQWLPSGGPLGRYTLRNPLDLRVAKTLWLMIVLGALAMALVATLFRRLRGRALGLEQRVAQSAGTTGGVLAVLYSLLGYADFGVLVLVGTGALGVFRLYPRISRISVGKISSIAIAGLLILNGFIAVETVRTDFHAGQKDGEISDVSRGMAEWYLAHGHRRTLASDVLTTGYVLVVATTHGQGNTSQIGVVSTDQLLALIGHGDPQLLANATQGAIFAVNLDERHFSLFGWDQFQAWSNLDPEIASNIYVDSIYDSGDYKLYLYGK